MRSCRILLKIELHTDQEHSYRFPECFCDSVIFGTPLAHFSSQGASKITRLTRGARPALGQVFRGQRTGYGDRWVALTQLTGACYYDDATVEDSKVSSPGSGSRLWLQVLGQ